MSDKGSIGLGLSKRQPLLKDKSTRGDDQSLLPKAIKTHPRGSEGDENANVYFIGTATTIIEWEGFRLLTDPNFLHAGDHVHLGPGVTAQRQTNPAVDLHELPSLDAILLSHYHEDHFDRLVEDSLNRDFLIVTTPHAHKCLTSKNEPFRNVKPLDFFDHLELKNEDSKAGEPLPVIKVTGMPGKHVPPGPLAAVNDLLGAVPPTNGWMLELGYHKVENGKLQTGYRIYISGDTLLVDELKEIPKWLREERIDLMLIHLGGTTIPGPSAPLDLFLCLCPCRSHDLCRGLCRDLDLDRQPHQYPGLGLSRGRDLFPGLSPGLFPGPFLDLFHGLYPYPYHGRVVCHGHVLAPESFHRGNHAKDCGLASSVKVTGL
ncbi:hypothetical protein FOC4_g10010423 [Fusarium odoratissimum]|uniref:Metallo-beta-lactamase domain-containing protein n=1 Tax=Fusarium oxysporum f. sp. cubense (strain race 4) TaxID=2502994 RepID=N1RE07_FUSC4|nr:hypothetical protein FOC4_g10010423 [Fusarium odoratissimum]